MIRRRGGSTEVAPRDKTDDPPIRMKSNLEPSTQEVLAGLVERFGWTFAPGDKVVQIENDYDGGGKGPQFKTDAERREGHGDWGTYQLQMMKLPMASHAKTA